MPFKNALAALLQHNIIFWYSDSKPTVYEPNFSAVHDLLRVGKYVEIAGRRGGQIGEGIVSFLFRVGHARVSEVISTCVREVGLALRQEKTKSSKSTAKSVNGDEHQQVSSEQLDTLISEEAVHSVLALFLSTGHLHRTHESFFRTLADNRNKAQRIVVAETGVMKAKGSKKDQEEMIENGIQAELDAWKYGNECERRDLEQLTNSKKRPAMDMLEAKSSKRPKLTEQPMNETSQPPSTSEATTLLNDGMLKVPCGFIHD